MFEYIALGLTLVVVPTTGWLINKVIDTEKRMEAHIASDTAMFDGLTTALNDLKTGQHDTSMKLDRLLESSLQDSRQAVRDATQAALTHAGELRAAAANALVIVETAKKSALEVVAEAFRVASTKTQ